MAAYRRVYDSHHLQADCQEPGSAMLGNRVWATFTFSCTHVGHGSWLRDIPWIQRITDMIYVFAQSPEVHCNKVLLYKQILLNVMWQDTQTGLIIAIHFQDTIVNPVI